MNKTNEKRSEHDRREKSDKRTESILNFFIPEKEEKRSGQDRRKEPKPAFKKKR